MSLINEIIQGMLEVNDTNLSKLEKKQAVISQLVNVEGYQEEGLSETIDTLYFLSKRGFLFAKKNKLFKKLCCV
jgi:hypothetical protein